jgi:hypothetical protein
MLFRMYKVINNFLIIKILLIFNNLNMKLRQIRLKKIKNNHLKIFFKFINKIKNKKK